MADKSDNGTETKRKPFKKGEREQTLELLGKAVLGLEDDQAKLKRRKETIKKLTDDLRANGYLDEPQGTIPGTEDESGARA